MTPSTCPSLTVRCRDPNPNPNPNPNLTLTLTLALALALTLTLTLALNQETCEPCTEFRAARKAKAAKV